MNDHLEPVITLTGRQEQDGTYTAIMTVSGLRSELELEATGEHLQRLFCGEEIAPNDGLPT